MASPVRRRRRRTFPSPDAILIEARSLAETGYVQLGNWSLGQVCLHLAAAMNSAIDGISLPDFAPRWLMLLGPLLKPMAVGWRIPSGYRLRGEAVTVLSPPPTETAVGLTALAAAIDRTRQEPYRTARHPIFGRMSQEEWNRFHCRHAELHLGFLIPQTEMIPRTEAAPPNRRPEGSQPAVRP